jgi:hypothetical protein
MDLLDAILLVVCAVALTVYLILLESRPVTATKAAALDEKRRC